MKNSTIWKIWKIKKIWCGFGMKCRDRQCWVSTFCSVRSVFAVLHCIVELTWTSSLIEVYSIFSYFLTLLKSVQSDVFLIFLMRYLLYSFFVSFYLFLSLFSLFQFIIVESPTCAYYLCDINLSVVIATLCLRSEINSILIIL